MSAEFDIYAKNYNELLKQGMVLKGNDHSYFEDYKLFYLNKYLKKSKKILDYGCGIGNLSLAISKKYNNIAIHGYDISRDSIKCVPDELTKKVFNRFVSTNRLLDKDYDLIILSTMLHHVPKDKRELIILDAWSRLKKDGHLIIIEHNLINPLTKKSVENCPLDKDAIFLSMKEAKGLFSKAYNNTLFCKYIVFWPKQLKIFRFLDSLLGFIPLGAQFMIAARKG